MGTEATRPPKVPPRWFVHVAWRVHRALYRVSGGRFLWTTSNKRGWGALRLTTVGRKSGQERNVIVGYVEDGPNLVVLAMNGWQGGHPSWWLNLEAHPDAVVRLAGQPARPVRALPVAGEERDRLWRRWVAVEPQLDGYAGRRSTETPVIVLGTARRDRLTQARTPSWPEGRLGNANPRLSICRAHVPPAES
jgi:F420H(2)-dependent quinone reductase